ncbi:type IV secretory system conjugative DNA transfer family protein [Mycolicibacterium fortuitum]|nr:type IV secretory system conjugative DNA transfer family protein [Mycolicibacterium fortuitum]
MSQLPAAGLGVPDHIDLAPGVQLPPEIVTATVAILANRGGGKSAVAHRLVELMYAAGLPVVVIDIKGDWWGIRSSADGTSPGLPFYIFGGDHGDLPLEPTAGELLADLIVDDRIPAVLDLSHMSKTQARTFATAFAERLYHRNRDPLHVVIEEADVLVPQRASAATARLLGAMEDLAKRGRHRGIGMTICTQRAQETAKSVLDLMETVILLRTTGPRSIKAVADWISVNASQDDTTARTVVSSLPSLPTGHGWIWSPSFLGILERVAFPLFTTFDSHATPKPGQRRIVPNERAEIDLDKLGAEIAATRQRAQDSDPRRLHTEIQSLRSEMAAAKQRADEATRHAATLAQQLADRDHHIDTLRAQIDELTDDRAHTAAVESLRAAIDLIESSIDTLVADHSAPPTAHPDRAATPAPAPVAAPTSPTPPPAPLRPPSDQPEPTTTRFRAGAHRMINALATMAPLRLTKAQWATVAHMKHTGGTWSTYLGEIRRAGLIDETPAGFTLTQAGWDYLGTRPEPMTAQQLQRHYLDILRAGAARMLQAVIDAHPDGLAKDQLADVSGVTASGGTFSTYLGDLRRNGLIALRGDRIVATDILMYGASAPQRPH